MVGMAGKWKDLGDKAGVGGPVSAYQPVRLSEAFFSSHIAPH